MAEAYFSYHIELPFTIFTHNTTINYQVYSSYQINYSDSERNLNPSQLKSIRETGEFEVKSNIESFPYKWKISKWVTKGTENIKESFFDDLSVSYYLLYCLKYRFMYKSESFGNFGDGIEFEASIPNGALSIINSIENLLSLFIGTPRFVRSKDETQIKHDIYFQFIQEFIKKNPEFKVDFFNPTKKQICYNALIQNWVIFWLSKNIELEQTLYDDNNDTDLILLELRRLHNEHLVSFIEAATNSEYGEGNAKLIFDEQSASLMIELIKSLFIYHESHSINSIEKEKDLEILRKDIKKTFYIKSRINEINSMLFDSLSKPINEKYEKKIQEEICYKLSEYNFQNANLLYQSNLEYKKSFNSKLETNLSKAKYVYTPKYTIEVKRLLCPKFRVVQEQRRNYANNGYYTVYHLEKSTTTTVSSYCPFWRFQLLLLRFLLYTWNIWLISLKLGTKSCLGFYALFFYTLYIDYTIDSETGVVSECTETATYPNTLHALCKWIRRSRDEFESSSDEGFFGKACGRIFNLISNYFFKMFLVGLSLLIFYPILIILNTVFYLLIFIMSPIIALLFALIRYLVTMLIYDTDGYDQNDNHIFLLFFYIIFRLLIFGVFQIIFSILLIVFQPLLSVIIVIWGILRYLTRHFYDCFMFCIVKCFAKVPKTNTKLCYMVSGPGVSRQLYNYLPIEDAMTLVHGELEKIQLIKFEEELHYKLEAPQRNFNTYVETELIKHHLRFTQTESLSRSISEAKSILSRCISERKSLYPRINITFKYSLEELNILKKSSRDYIKGYVSSHEMGYVFKKYNIAENSWIRLTEIILKNALGNNILETLDQTDFRVEIIKNENNEFTELKERLFNKSNYNPYSIQMGNQIIEKVPIPRITTISDIFDYTLPFFIDISVIGMNNQTLGILVT